MGSQRALGAALRRLLQDGFDGDQTAIRASLAAMGWEVSQSSVSRALQRLGARRAVVRRGSVRYELALSRPGEPEPRSEGLADLVVSLVSNETLIVVKTRPGCASAVAACLDGCRSPEILGSVAGDDTVMVVPRSTKQMAKALVRVAEVLGYQAADKGGRR